MTVTNKQTTGEEILNAVTHGVGALLSIVALPTLLVFASQSGNMTAIISVAVYGSTLILMYLTSTLYHAFTHHPTKTVFQRLDHICIYLLIAGTYTPITLCVIGGSAGWTIFGIIWGLALFGTVFKAVFGARYDTLSAFLYVIMGWMILIDLQSLYRNLPLGGFILLVLGGVFYTLGVPFYLKDTSRKWYHGIWHCFILLGSICHFMAIALYVV